MSLNRFKYLRLLLLISIFHVIYRSNARTSDGIIISESNLQGLQAFKQSLEDPKGFLKSWNDTGIGACLGTWYGIKCVKGQVIAIQLPWRGLGGKITEKIGQLSGLRKLSLHDNFIGGQIPASIGFLQNLKGLVLFNNRFSGNIPPSIGNCLFLQTLDLSNNTLIGSIPPSISTSSKLYRVNLSYNSLSGSIPTGLTQSPSLTFLSLQNNDLSGSVSDTWGDETITYQLQILNLDNNSFIGNVPSTFSRLPLLQEITLSNNKFSGRIPEEIGSLPKIQKLDFSNNSITGDFPSSFPNLSSLLELRLDNNHISNSIPESIDGMQKLAIFSVKHNNLSGEIPATLGNITTLYHLDLSDNALSGEIPSSIEKLSNLTFFNVSNNKLSGQVPFLLSQKFKPSSFSGNIQLCGYSPSTPCPTPPPSVSPSSAVAQKTKKLSTRDIILIVSGAILATLLLLCCILLCCLIRKRVKSKQQSKSTGAGPATSGRAEKPGPAAGPEVESGGEAGGKLVHFDGPFVFTADDLLCATAEIMGKSTYGTVYKATLEDGNEVAVKRLREKIAKGQKEFEAEVNIIGKIRHENLLALRAYYLGPKGEKLLVFDYMPKGSLAAFLHARGPDSPINWATRMKIIKGTTKGLNYLHNEVNMIHGNLTSSNILLDGEMNAKISDHGLSRLMTGAANAAVVTAAGALGYRAPELVKVKKAGVKTDVYSLGVVMLELLTGKSPAEEMGGMDLPQWVASIVKEEWTNEVFDLELMREVEGSVGDELLNTLKLALHCVDPTPGARPDVAQVMVQLEEIRPEVGGGASTSGSVADPSSSMGEADDV